MKTMTPEEPEDDDELIDPNRSGDNAFQRPKSPLRLMIDTDGDTLQVRLLNYKDWPEPGHEGAVKVDKDKCKQFPNGKYKEREDAYFVPLTDPNLEHLFGSWKPEEYQTTDAAKMFIDYHLKTRQLGDLKLDERMQYLLHGKAPEPKDYVFCEKYKPREHQVTAYASGVASEYFALLMDMGTGKSKVMVDIICNRARRMIQRWKAENPTWERDKLKPPQFKALIVAPKTVCMNWADPSPEIGEFAKHATLDCSIERLRGKATGRCDQLVQLLKDLDHSACRIHSDGGCDGTQCVPANTPVLIAVINYEGMTDLQDMLKLIAWDIMILDESIKIKSQSAKRSKAAKLIRANAKSAFILTGLPITKDVKDLYSQFDFLKAGCLGYTSKKTFEERYCDNKGDLLPDRLPELQKMLSRISFVVKAEQCLDLPPKTYQTLHVDMAEDQADAYDSMLQQMIVDFEAMEQGYLTASAKEAGEKAAVLMDSEGVELDVEALAKERAGKYSVARIMVVQMLRLAQITSGFLKMADGSIRRFKENPKLEALEDYFEQIDTRTGGKVIVWATFREDNRAIFERFAPTMGGVRIQGGMRDQDLQDAIRRFMTDDECRLLVANPASGGQGLNLTKARHAIYFSQGWSLDHREQSEKRCHRLGQTGSVLYSTLAVPNSIDETISARLQRKRDIAELLTDKGRIITALKDQLAARLARR